MIYTTVMYLVKKHSGYNNRYNFQTKSKVEEFPKIDWFEENGMLLVFINLAIVVLIMFTFSEIIKKWRGIPEE
jgi:hypothetical protein